MIHLGVTRPTKLIKVVLENTYLGPMLQTNLGFCLLDVNISFICNMLSRGASDGALTTNLSIMPKKTFNLSVGSEFECLDTISLGTEFPFPDPTRPEFMIFFPFK
jgi:hypothetical protein